MIAVGWVGILIARVRGFPVSIDPTLYVVLISVAPLYGLSKLPLRIRLTFEISTAILLLALSAWIWRPPFYVNQAERTGRLARLCSQLAGEDGIDDASRALFRRKAAWYGRQALVLRLQAMWFGLIRSATKDDPAGTTDRELILELGTLEALDRHERIAKGIGIGTKNGASGSLY